MPHASFTITRQNVYALHHQPKRGRPATRLQITHGAKNASLLLGEKIRMRAVVALAAPSHPYLWHRASLVAGLLMPMQQILIARQKLICSRF